MILVSGEQQQVRTGAGFLLQVVPREADTALHVVDIWSLCGLTVISGSTKVNMKVLN